MLSFYISALVIMLALWFMEAVMWTDEKNTFYSWQWQVAVRIFWQGIFWWNHAALGSDCGSRSGQVKEFLTAHHFYSLYYCLLTWKLWVCDLLCVSSIQLYVVPWHLYTILVWSVRTFIFLGLSSIWSRNISTCPSCLLCFPRESIGTYFLGWASQFEKSPPE